ncbi:MAG: sugar phosphate isomerase/epimerase [Ferruginibacter sp.]|nr:sugar phosphate isomerase/epimerase [Cytophagales bacterium]
MNRREWNKLALGGLATLAAPATGWANNWLDTKPNSKIKGVQIGIQSYSLRDRGLAEAIQAIAEVGINSCELWSGHVEPKELTGEERQKWRMTVSLDEMKKVADQFKKAGVQLSAYNYSFRDQMSDGEIERGFQMAKALGVNTMTASSTVSIVKRIDPFAQKYKIRVGLHNHDKIEDLNEFSNAASFERATQGASPFIVFNLDVGHFVAANDDPIAFIRQHHERIVMIHLKDRKRNHGSNEVFGQGETPLKEVLALLRDNKYAFPANIEYEYKGADTVTEIKKCLDYCKQALA